MKYLDLKFKIYGQKREVGLSSVVRLGCLCLDPVNVGNGTDRSISE